MSSMTLFLLQQMGVCRYKYSFLAQIFMRHLGSIHKVMSLFIYAGTIHRCLGMGQSFIGRSSCMGGPWVSLGSLLEVPKKHCASHVFILLVISILCQID